MFNTNPFAELSTVIDPTIMQVYIVIMALFVAGGTLFDIVHKRSAIYFFRNWGKSKANAKKKLSAGKMATITIQTALVEGATSAEFCSLRRRLAHLLTMYGFIAYVAATAIMVTHQKKNFVKNSELKCFGALEAKIKLPHHQSWWKMCELAKEQNLYDIHTNIRRDNGYT